MIPFSKIDQFLVVKNVKLMFESLQASLSLDRPFGEAILLKLEVVQDTTVSDRYVSASEVPRRERPHSVRATVQHQRPFRDVGHCTSQQGRCL